MRITFVVGAERIVLAALGKRRSSPAFREQARTVRAARIGLATAAGVVIALGAAAVPAFGAADQARAVPRRPVTVRGLGAFTPSSADPRLAAVFARGGLGTRGFRFTPAEVRADRAVTVAVRARSARGAVDGERAVAAAPTVGLAPIAYNLGVAVGWRRFALQADAARVELPGQPGGRDAVDVGVSYSLPRITTRVRATADRPAPGSPGLIDDRNSYALDVGSSYSLTRNLDVTAGVRYRTDRDRLPRIDDRRDSQAVYLGTAFRF